MLKHDCYINDSKWFAILKPKHKTSNKQQCQKAHQDMYLVGT